MNIFKDIPESQYRAHKSLNQSTLKKIFQSKMHALWEYNRKEYEKEMPVGTKKRSSAFDFGSAFHEYLFMGDEVFRESFEVCGYRERLKDTSKTRISSGDFWHIKNMSKHLKKYEIGKEMPLFKKEQSIFWEMGGMECKARLDLVHLEEFKLIDVKTFARTDELKKPSDEIFWTILRRKYYFQLAFYLKGLEILTEKNWTAYFIFIEKSPPYQFTYFQMPDFFLEKGYRDVKYAMDVFSSPFDPCGEDNYPKTGEILEIPENYKEIVQ